MAATDQRPDRSDPIHRGLFIYRSLVVVSSIGTPPANATPDVPLPADATNGNVDFRMHIADEPRLLRLSRLFDAFGLATERYDPIGRYVPTIDSTATISPRLGPALAGPVTGLPDVIARLEQGRIVSDCAVANLAQMTLGRQVQDDTSCAVKNVKDKFAASVRSLTSTVALDVAWVHHPRRSTKRTAMTEKSYISGALAWPAQAQPRPECSCVRCLPPPRTPAQSGC